MAAWPIPAPVLRQIPLVVHARCAAPARITEQHPELAVLDPTGGTAIRAIAPNRMRTLLDAPGLLEHEHGLRGRKMGDNLSAQGVAHRLRFPRAAIEHPRHAVGAPLPEPFGHLPTSFALTSREPCTQLAECSAARLTSAATRRNAAVELFQLMLPLLHHLPHAWPLLCVWGVPRNCGCRTRRPASGIVCCPPCILSQRLRSRPLIIFGDAFPRTLPCRRIPRSSGLMMCTRR
jgi:hypothetical protein